MLPSRTYFITNEYNDDGTTVQLIELSISAVFEAIFHEFHQTTEKAF